MTLNADRRKTPHLSFLTRWGIAVVFRIRQRVALTQEWLPGLSLSVLGLCFLFAGSFELMKSRKFLEPERSFWLC